MKLPWQRQPLGPWCSAGVRGRGFVPAVYGCLAGRRTHFLRVGTGRNLPYMREMLGPLRAAAITAFITGVALLLLDPPSLVGLRNLLVLLVGAVVFVWLAAWAVVTLEGDDMPDAEFERLVDRSEALASL